MNKEKQTTKLKKRWKRFAEKAILICPKHNDCSTCPFCQDLCEVDKRYNDKICLFGRLNERIINLKEQNDG